MYKKEESKLKEIEEKFQNKKTNYFTRKSKRWKTATKTATVILNLKKEY